MKNALEAEGRGYVIPSEIAPNADQRAFMVRRAQDIEAAFEPAPEKVLLAEVTGLLGTMALRKGDEKELKAVFEIYMADLSDLPAFAVRKACLAFRRGDVGDGKWAPTPGELRKLAKTYTEPWVDERAKLLRVLGAKVLPPVTAESLARRDAVLAHVRETLGILRHGCEPKEPARPLTMVEAQQWLDNTTANPPPAIELSEGLQAALGIRRRCDAA